MKEAVVTIRMKDSDKFEGQSKGSTGWFNLDHDFFLNLNQNSIKLYKKDIEGLYMEPNRTLFTPFYSTKLDLFNHKDPVKNRE